ncbi:MAG TPA: hypothetical protein VNA28_17105 [Solirubrobacteraceae bacterium]|nr:hypothetical protein [Solirubrobacteraceae bacterium]
MTRIGGWWSVFIAAAILLLSLGTDAQAPAAYPLVVHLVTDTSQAGVVSLTLFGALGTPVTFYERVGERLEKIETVTTPTGVPTVLPHAVAWRCDRLVRQFVAKSIAPDGRPGRATHDVRTPSCGTRFALEVPPRVKRGKVGRIRIVDRWNNGDIAVRLCIRRPGDRYTCRELRFGRAVTVMTHRFRPRESGRWSAELRLRDHTTHKSIAVGKREIKIKPSPTVLVTGDSSMQGIDSFLADELGHDADVRSDVHLGTGLVKAGGPWENLAAFQTRVVKQDVTVMSIGAADDFRLRAFDGSIHECCDEAWIAEYSGRVKKQMLTYLRGGRARVIWLTLPIPRGERPFVAASINDAILRASAGLAGVSVVRMDIVFTPEGHREVMDYRGSTLPIFRADGVHLTIAGTAIAAKLVAEAVRAS